MNCPQCNTWNPDDKRVCWRCQAELPKPVEKKQRAPGMVLGLPSWVWIMVVAMGVLWMTMQCMGPALLPGS